MNADAVNLLRPLEQDNTCFKRLLDERGLEVEVMKVVAAKKVGASTQGATFKN